MELISKQGTNDTKWKNEHYLPLLHERDGVMLAEILHLADLHPTLLIYKSKKRNVPKVRSKQFQDEILHDFTKETFDDLVDCLKPNILLVSELLSWKPHLPTNVSYLELSIRLHCGIFHSDLFQATNTQIIWTEEQLLHWRFYFAKILISS